VGTVKPEIAYFFESGTHHYCHTPRNGKSPFTILDIYFSDKVRLGTRAGGKLAIA
jgi:hypothetical protein